MFSFCREEREPFDDVFDPQNVYLIRSGTMSPVSPRDGQLVRGGHLPPTENCSRQPLASAPSLPSKAPIGSNRLSAHAALPVLHADRSGNANIRKRASKSQRMIDRWLQEKTSTYFRTAH